MNNILFKTEKQLKDVNSSKFNLNLEFDNQHIALKYIR